MKKVEETKTVTQKAEATEVPVAHVEERVKEKSSGMPRKTLVLILLLVVITVGLLAIALLPGTKPSTVKEPAPLALTYAQTNLSFSAPVNTALNSYSTDVLISTGNNKTTAVQLEIVYDPKVLTNVTVAPGTFFTSPVVLLKKIDAVNGRISYALGINATQKPTAGSGTVATITFSTAAGTTATQTPINFSPKTETTAVGYAQSVLKQATGVLFTLPSTTTP